MTNRNWTSTNFNPSALGTVPLSHRTLSCSWKDTTIFLKFFFSCSNQDLKNSTKKYFHSWSCLISCVTWNWMKIIKTSSRLKYMQKSRDCSVLVRAEKAGVSHQPVPRFCFPTFIASINGPVHLHEQQTCMHPLKYATANYTQIPEFFDDGFFRTNKHKMLGGGKKFLRCK